MLAFFLLFFSATLSFAGDKARCAVEKIVENEAVNRGNTRDQRPIGWCYAYAASDLVSFRLNKRVSATALHSSNRNAFLDQLSEKDKSGGHIKEAIDFSLDFRKGFCLESEVRSSDFGFTESQNLKDLVLRVEELKSKTNAKKPCNLEQSIGQSPLFADLKKFLPALEVAQFATQNWEQLITSACKNKVQLPKFDIIKQTAATSEMPVAIDNQLNKNSICGISYSLNKLAGRTDLEDHASVVIGRRWNEKIQQCEYLVRNSWGNNCKFKNREDLYCDKNKDGTDNGHFWVGEDRLKNSLKGATYIEPYF